MNARLHRIKANMADFLNERVTLTEKPLRVKFSLLSTVDVL